MKKRRFLWVLFFVLVICQSCRLFGTRYTTVSWYLALRGNDTLLVTYPCNVSSDILNESMRFDTMLVCGDTIISQATATNREVNYVNFYSISKRETFYDDVEIVFIARDTWIFWHSHVEDWVQSGHNDFTNDFNDTAFWNPIFRKHAVTLPKDQKSIMVHLRDCDCSGNP